jgi:hypothetical protein
MENNEGPEIDWSDLDELQPHDSTVDVLREAEQQGTGDSSKSQPNGAAASDAGAKAPLIEMRVEAIITGKQLKSTCNLQQCEQIASDKEALHVFVVKMLELAQASALEIVLTFDGTQGEMNLNVGYGASSSREDGDKSAKE